MKTIDEARQEARAAIEEAAATVERLREERAALSPEALSGDEVAQKKLAELEGEINEAGHRARLAEEALAELERRAEEEREQAEEDRRRELEAEHDRLAKERKKKLQGVERALDALSAKGRELLEHDQEQRRVLEDLGRVHGQASYNHILESRIIGALSHLLPGAGPGRRESLTSDDVFCETIAEAERRKEEGIRKAEAERAEGERLRQRAERARMIEERRYELTATRMDYTRGSPRQRQEIEEEAERILTEEFPESEAREESS